MYYGDYDKFLTLFSTLDEIEKEEVAKWLVDAMVYHICQDDYVFELDYKGIPIRVDGLHPRNPRIYFALQDDAIIGIVVSEYSCEDSFDLSVFKGSTDLDEISGCTLPIQLKEYVDLYLNNCLNNN